MISCKQMVVMMMSFVHSPGQTAGQPHGLYRLVLLRVTARVRRVLFLLIFLPLVLLLAITLCLPPVPVSAEASVRSLPVADIKEQGTYLFTIGWDHGELSTTLIAPDGRRIR